MKDLLFHYVADLSGKYGRCITMCSHRGDIFMATDTGHILRLTENVVSGQVYLQEVHMLQAAPMPNPI